MSGDAICRTDVLTTWQVREEQKLASRSLGMGCIVVGRPRSCSSAQARPTRSASTLTIWRIILRHETGASRSWAQG